MDTGRNELQDVAIVLQRPALLLGGVPHLERVLQDGDELLDLAIVEHPRWNPALGSQSLEQVHPLSPLAILWPLDGAHVLGQRNGKLVFGNKVVCTLRQTVVHLSENGVLFLDQEVGGKVREFSLLKRNIVRSRRGKKLMRSVEFIPVGRSTLRPDLSVRLILPGRCRAGPVFWHVVDRIRGREPLGVIPRCLRVCCRVRPIPGTVAAAASNA